MRIHKDVQTLLNFKNISNRSEFIAYLLTFGDLKGKENVTWRLFNDHPQHSKIKLIKFWQRKTILIIRTFMLKQKHC